VVALEGEGLGRAGFHSGDLLGREFAAVHPESRAVIGQVLAGAEASFTLHGRGEGGFWYIDFYAAPSEEGGAAFFGRDITERRWLEHRLLMATDLEQRRIGADLHEGLGQKLTGLAFLATALREWTKGSDAETARQADLVARLANEAVQQSRALARSLCPVEVEESGLLAALSVLGQQTRILHRTGCRFIATTKLAPPGQLASIHLYRIAQEAISNAIKHGGARHIDMSLEAEGDRYCLTVADDGAGFSPGAGIDANSHGVRLMKFRATMINGWLSIESQPGKGTKVCCRFGASALAEPAR
jgi:signal transduction histidine kinase